MIGRRQAGGRGRGARSGARVGRSRPGQDHPRRRGGTVRLRRRGLRFVRALRGGPRHALSTLRRGARPLRHPRSRGPTLAHVEAHGSELSRLVPALASRSANLPPSKATDSDSERFLLFSAVVGLLTVASTDQPVVIVLDDLQWADKGSLVLLRHLAAAVQPMRVLVLGTYRDSELSQSTPLPTSLASCIDQSGVSRIELAGLDDSAVISFLEAAAGQALDEAGVDLAQAVLRETDGNPFFVARGAAPPFGDRGDLPGRHAAGGWPGSALDQWPCPPASGAVIGARVGRLGEGSKGCCQWRRSSAATSTSTSWPRQPRPARTTSSTFSTPPQLSPRCASWPTRVATASPTP